MSLTTTALALITCQRSLESLGTAADVVKQLAYSISLPRKSKWGESEVAVWKMSDKLCICDQVSNFFLESNL